ncbi:MAG: hypothetical protein QXP66_00990 [Candidatus Aenigmatarchaeota archaeon]
MANKTINIRNPVKTDLSKPVNKSMFGPLLKKILPKLILIPAITGTAYGAFRIISAIQQRSLEKKQQETFQKMHKFFPELEKLDPMQKQEIFNAIAQLNPGISTNPWIMGSLVSRIGAAQFITPDLIQQLKSPKPSFEEAVGIFRPFISIVS